MFKYALTITGAAALLLAATGASLAGSTELQRGLLQDFHKTDEAPTTGTPRGPELQRGLFQDFHFRSDDGSTQPPRDELQVVDPNI